ncbi:MAG: SBBP repeat-containing protein [Bacteroidetes bacterium]|nr:SBBP repeat-containing protein [Bacteroidota bacterium]
MKKHLLHFLLILILEFGYYYTFAQIPYWQWAKEAGGNNSDEAYSVTTDDSGKLYVVGYFGSSSITFGSYTLTNKNAGTPDIFLAKYDAAGNVLWTASAGGTDNDYAYSVATNRNGDIYVVGWFQSDSITFGSTTLTNANNSGFYNDDLFITKYNAAGNVLWTQGARGIFSDEALSVTTDSSGNIYMAGWFASDTISIGSDTLTNANIGSFTPDIFLAKYDKTGNVLWVRGGGGSGDDRTTSVTTDDSNNVYIVGFFESPSITFGSTTLATANVGSFDMFIVKYDEDGNVLWAKAAGGTNALGAYSVATDISGNIFVLGGFQSPSITFGSNTLTNVGSRDIFLTKYDEAGNVLWAKAAGGTEYDYASSISTDLNGSVYIAGSFRSYSITFNSDTLTNKNAGTPDIFLAKYDASGILLWALSAGETDYDETNSVTTDPNGNVYMTGYFQSDFITFGSTTITNAGGYDMFLVKYNIQTRVENLNSSSFDEMMIFPNPTTGKVSIAGIGANINTIEIFDLFGKTIHIYNFEKGKTQIAVSVDDMPVGVYYYKVMIKGLMQKTGKVIIIH